MPSNPKIFETKRLTSTLQYLIDCQLNYEVKSEDETLDDVDCQVGYNLAAQ